MSSEEKNRVRCAHMTVPLGEVCVRGMVVGGGG